MSQFDTLLEFDAHAENGSTNHDQSSTLDDFDPFGPIPSLDKSGGPSLLDEFESEFQNGTTRQNGSTNLLIDISEPANPVSNDYSPGTKFDTSNQLFDLSENMDDESNPEEVRQLVEQASNGDLEYSFTETVTTTSDRDDIPVIAIHRSRSYDSDKEEHNSSSDDEKHTDEEMVSKVTEEQQWYNTDENQHNGYNANDNQFETNITETVYYADEHEHEHEREQSDNDSDREEQYKEETTPPSIVQERQESHDHDVRARHRSSSSSSKSDSDKNDDEKHDNEQQLVRDGKTVYKTKDEKHFSETRDSNDPNKFAVDESTSPYLDKPPYADDSDEEEIERDPNIARETKTQEDIRCSDMSNFRQHFESGGKKDRPVGQSAADLDDLRQANVQAGSIKSKFENIAKEKDRPMERKGIKEITPPVQDRIVYEADEERPRDPNIVRSADMINEDEYLPRTGTSREMMQRLQTASSQQVTKSQRPLREEIQTVEGGVYESNPTEFVQWQNRADGGVFENEPVHNPGVVRSDIDYDASAELPESGYAQNVLAKFKQIQSSPDQYSGGPRPARREITPPSDVNRVEFVSEPRGYVERYEGKAEAGVFESQPQIRSDVVRANEAVFEEQLPEEGYTRNVADKFKRLEKEGPTYTPTPKQREFTPPTEGGIFENQPQIMPDVVRSSEKVEETEALPQQGTARNLVARFRSFEQTSKSPPSPSTPKEKKLFTPPRDVESSEGGVFENEPERFTYYENKSEGGVFENQPVLRDDVVREDKAWQEVELPEQGTSRNLIARFKQMESQSRTSSSTSPRTLKQFTPPRDEPRLKSPRSPGDSGVANGVQPSDMPEQYQTQTDGGIYENQPERREDVYKEEDTDYSEGMPPENAAKHMVDRFKHIQAEAKKEMPKPISRKAGNVQR